MVESGVLSCGPHHSVPGGLVLPSNRWLSARMLGVLDSKCTLLPGPKPDTVGRPTDRRSDGGTDGGQTNDGWKAGGRWMVHGWVMDDGRMADDE